MALLSDTFRTRESRVTKTIVAIDLKDSAGMKEKEPEASWLTTYGWFFDLLTTTIGNVAYKDKDKGKIVKYLGDGAMIIFNEDSPADAINWSIEIQERIADAQAERRVSCDCSIGIAYGEVVEFDTPQGAKDYIGTVVDKAFRLCSAANAKAIFVDTETVSAAAMNRIRSRLGAIAPRRTPAEYQGPDESVTVKGFSRPVAYHEIMWGNTRYGVSSPFVTKLSSQQAAAPSPSFVAAETPAGTQWRRGRIISLSDRFGFIRSEGEDFWFNQNSLFRRALQVELNNEVWFIPADPFPGAKARRAIDIVALGTVLDGKLERVNPKGFAFVLCANERGESRKIFVYLGDVGGWSAGMQIEFKVGENKFGFAGVEAKTKE
jgi:class 3 adenylate cyclase